MTSALATVQFTFGGICVGLVLIGVAAQFLAGSFSRAGSLPDSASVNGIENRLKVESAGRTTSNPLKEYLYEMMLAFERELVQDLGSVLGQTANILLFASVMAALVINFPQLGTVGYVVVALIVLVALLVSLFGVDQMARKRKRMQNLFEALRSQDDAEVIAYFVQRHPSFERWSSLSRFSKLLACIRQAVYTAMWYRRRETQGP